METVKVLINAGVKPKEIIQTLEEMQEDFKDYEILMPIYLVFCGKNKKGGINGTIKRTFKH